MSVWEAERAYGNSSKYTYINTYVHRMCVFLWLGVLLDLRFYDRQSKVAGVCVHVPYVLNGYSDEMKIEKIGVHTGSFTYFVFFLFIQCK